MASLIRPLVDEVYALSGARPMSQREAGAAADRILDWIAAQGGQVHDLGAWMLESPAWSAPHMAAALRAAARRAMDHTLDAVNFTSLDTRMCIEVAEGVWTRWATKDGVAQPSTHTFGGVRRTLGKSHPSEWRDLLLSFIDTNIRIVRTVKTSTLQRAAWLNAMACEVYGTRELTAPLSTLRPPHVPPHGVRLGDVKRVAAEVRAACGLDDAGGGAATGTVSLAQVTAWQRALGGTSPCLTLAILAAACTDTLHATLLRVPLPRTVGLPCVAREALAAHAAAPLNPASLLNDAIARAIAGTDVAGAAALAAVVPPPPAHIPTARSMLSTDVPPVERFMTSTRHCLSLAYGNTLDSVQGDASAATAAEGGAYAGGGLAALLPQPDETRGSLVVTLQPVSGVCTFYLFAPLEGEGLCMSTLTTCVLDAPLLEEEDEEGGDAEGDADGPLYGATYPPTPWAEYVDDVIRGSAAAAARASAGGGAPSATKPQQRAPPLPLPRTRAYERGGGGGGGGGVDDDDDAHSVATRPSIIGGASVLRGAGDMAGHRARTTLVPNATSVGGRTRSVVPPPPTQTPQARDVNTVVGDGGDAGALTTAHLPRRAAIDWLTAVRDSNDVLTLAWGGRNKYTGAATWACHTGVDDVALLEGRFDVLFNVDSTFDRIDTSIFAERAGGTRADGSVVAGVTDLRVHGNLLSAHIVWAYASDEATTPTPTSYIIYQDTVLAALPSVAVLAVWGVPTRAILYTASGWGILEGGALSPLTSPPPPPPLLACDACVDIVPWSLTNDGLLNAATLQRVDE